MWLVGRRRVMQESRLAAGTWLRLDREENVGGTKINRLGLCLFAKKKKHSVWFVLNRNIHMSRPMNIKELDVCYDWGSGPSIFVIHTRKRLSAVILLSRKGIFPCINWTIEGANNFEMILHVKHFSFFRCAHLLSCCFPVLCRGKNRLLILG